MRLLDKYILYSSILALFTEDFSFHYVIDWKLFYVILLCNYFLLGINRKITIHKNILIVLFLLLAHGLVFFLWFQNPIKSLIAQLAGISFSSIYFYNFLRIYGSKIAFDKYVQVSFFIALIAIPMYLLKINTFTYNRLNGILTEPAHYAAIMLPAAYFLLRSKKYAKLTVIVVTIFMSRSTIGYLGMIAILFFPLFRLKNFMKYAWITVLILSIGIFYLGTLWNKPMNENESNFLVRRLKQTQNSLKSIYTGVFASDINLSTYAFLSNAFITREIVKHKPLGTGVGSYPYEYDKYYPLLEPPQYLLELKQSKINRTDANSLFLRMLGDFGIFALILFLYYFIKIFKLFRIDKEIIKQSTFFYLLTKFVREGHYFPPEFYFFLLLFLKDFDSDITYS